MNTRILSKASSIVSLGMIVAAMVLALLMVWTEISCHLVLTKTWASIGTVFIASTVISSITGEMTRSATR